MRGALQRLAIAGVAVWLASAAHADAPLGRYTITADTVRDNRTNLVWQRVISASTYSQPQAAAYCTSLPTAGGGWRLPTQLELRSIVDVTRINTAIDPTAFPNTPSAWFWTSSVYVLRAGWMWYVDFGDGGAYGQPSENPHRVRCVR